MYFQVLQRRLIGTMRDRVRNGELTERGLARLSGVSQPHIHNVLKGVRILSPEYADQVLRRLKINVFDLCETTELVPLQCRCANTPDPVRWIPGLANAIGPEHFWSPVLDRQSGYPLPARLVSNVSEPATAILGEDPRMLPRFRAGDTVLLDFEIETRRSPVDSSAYVIDDGGKSLVRYVHQGNHAIYLEAEDCQGDREKWECVSLANRNILDIVRARIVWMGRQMES